MNVRVDSLRHDSDQSMLSHKKFKQLIGYRELKVNRNKSHKKKEIIKTPLVLSPVRRSIDKSSGEICLQQQEGSSAASTRN